MNPDLFWGCAAGGGNFGVVTDLEYELVEVPVTRATTGMFVFKAMTPSSPRAGLPAGAVGRRADCHRHLERQTRLCEVAHAGTGGESEARDLLALLLAIRGVKAEITERPWWDCYRWYVVAPTWRTRSGTARYADEYLSDDALGAALEVVRRLPTNDDPQRQGAVGLSMGGGAVSDIGADATAYVHRPARMLIEMSSGGARRRTLLSRSPRPFRRALGWRNSGCCCRTAPAAPTRTSPTPPAELGQRVLRRQSDATRGHQGDLGPRGRVHPLPVHPAAALILARLDRHREHDSGVLIVGVEVDQRRQPAVLPDEHQDARPRMARRYGRCPRFIGMTAVSGDTHVMEGTMREPMSAIG